MTTKPQLPAKLSAMRRTLSDLRELSRRLEYQRQRREEIAADREYTLELIAERLTDIERRLTELERKKAEYKAQTGCYRYHI